MVDAPFAPNHLEFFATVTLHKHTFTIKAVRDWLTRLVETVDMQVLMPARAISCDDLGNEGISGIVMLKTSHSSIHIWDRVHQPYAKMVLYSCKPFGTLPILDLFQDLGARECRYELRERNHNTENDLLNQQMYAVIEEGTRDYRT